MEMQYEKFTKGGIEFELAGVRGDWGLHVINPEKYIAGWDGYINHYPTKADAKWFAGQKVEQLREAA
jgi:hypothetical protein